MKRKNAVRLKVKEKELLRQLLSRGKERARKLTRCRILLLADEGKKDARIIESLRVARNTGPPGSPKVCPGRLEGGNQ